MEAEQGVLGCILINPECCGECVTQFKSGSEVFYDLRHRTIYDVLIAMFDAREPIDLLTVQQKLRDRNQFEAVGGIGYVATLPDAVPSAANLESYLHIVREKYLLRSIIQVCTNTVARLYEQEGEVEALLDEVERDVLKICEDRVEIEGRPIRELVLQCINIIDDWCNRAGALTGIETGFPDLDKMTNGLQNGEMIVIAGRPSVGKSALAMNIAEHVAVDLGLSVGVFSLEMTAQSLVMRTLCSRARVNIRNIRDGFMAERDFPRLTASAGKIMAAPIHIDDSSGLSILQLRAKARRMTQQFGVKLLIVDYIQLLHSTNRKSDNRQQEVSDISSGIKALAKELGVPVIVLAQLNRKIEDRGICSKPRLSDLRESGSLEQDADLAAFLYKTKEDDSEMHDESIPVNLLIAKQRNGPTGEVPLTFLRAYTRFESAAKVSPDDVPDDSQTTIEYDT